MDIKRPYLLFLGDVPDALAAKTAIGIAEWRPTWCAGQMRLPGCAADAGLPDMTIEQAVAAGAKTFVIGVVNAGGVLPDHWIATVVSAIEAGLHMRLSDVPQIRAAAEARGATLHDVRHSSERFATGKGGRRPGRRLLTVGTDCSVGKKYTALVIEREMQRRGFNAEFRATGQTGVFISGRGVALDAVVADFISGAAEWLTPENQADHWDVVEGQGSLFHPSFAGVSLGLLHGSQPDAFVVCHEPTRETMRGVGHPLPTIGEVIDLTRACGRLTNPDIRCVGIAINTAALDEEAARAVLAEAEEDYDLPATDPVRFGVETLIDRLEKEFPV